MKKTSNTATLETAEQIAAKQAQVDAAKEAEKQNPTASITPQAEKPSDKPSESIVIDGRKYLPSRINKAVASYLSDHGRAKHAIARFASVGRVGADLKQVKNENVKAVKAALDAGALNSVLSDPVKFHKLASILVRLTQALEDLESL